MAKLLIFLGICSIGHHLVHGQAIKVCNDNTMDMCRRNIEDVLRGSDETRKMDVEDQCWRVRHNFDCVLWQTSMCLSQNDQENSSDVVVKGWRFLEGFCEKFTNWWTKPCYRSESLKRCDRRLPSKGRTIDKSSCRSYLDFRECATSAIEAECDSDDQRLLGVFLMEKGQQRAYKCPRDEAIYANEPINAPLAADTDDVMYSDSASGASCLLKATNEAKECLTGFEDVQKLAKDVIDEDSRREMVCCGAVKYEGCATKVLRDVCGLDAAKELPRFLGSFTSKIFYNCEDHTKDTCSSASIAGLTSFLLLLSFLLSSVFSFA